MRQVYRGLDVKPPIEDGDNRFRDIGDDAAAARRTDRQLKLPSAFSTRVGDIELRGRLPGSTRLAIGTPSRTARNEKSVSWLLSRNPPAMRREPNAFSTLDVIETRYRRHRRR